VPEAIQHIKLSDLNKNIQTVIERNFNNIVVWVIADITNHSFKEKTNYHYFDLVEKAPNSNELVAKISGKAWGTGSTKIRDFERITGQKFTNNINVLVRVKVNYHVVFGLSLDIQEIDPNFTIGVLEQQRQITLASLVANNPGVISKIGDRYISRNSKLTLPRVLQKIAVVASKTSAGNEDFRHTLENNPYGFKFDIDDYHTVVQNDANAPVFLERLIDVYKSGIKYDIVVITRGGGSQTDFLIFDNYKIGVAIARFPIPILTGIGHQKNETIADLMAHTQTKTPTKAAEFIIAHNKGFLDEILSFQKLVLIKSQQLVSVQFQSLATLNSAIVNNTRSILINCKDSLVHVNQITINTSKSIIYNRKHDLINLTSQILSKPKIILYNRISDIDNTINSIKSFNYLFLRNQKGYLGHYISVVKMMAPENILKKGFAIIKVNNKITSDPNTIVVGNIIDVILADTTIKSVVQQKTKYDGTEFNV
jgi:exodeoxyribonuclease VII large subunit